MTIDDSVRGAKDVVGIASELLKAAGNDPNVKAAGHQLGKAALTVARCINNALLPIAAVNFAFDKARGYFSTRFEAEMSAKAANIPPECVTDPKPSIAGPALQGLAFSYEEHDLKEMYLSLLASAMDTRRAQSAHPAFVEIIRQLTAEEALLLRRVLRRVEGLPIGEVRLEDKTSHHWVMLYQHLIDLRDTETGAAVENPRLPAMIDNWARLGLVEVTYDKYLSGAPFYDPLHARSEVVRLRAQRMTPQHDVGVRPGVLARTAFGQQFASVVGLFDEPLGVVPPRPSIDFVVPGA